MDIRNFIEQELKRHAIHGYSCNCVLEALTALLAEIEREVERLLPDGGGVRTVRNPTNEDFVEERILKEVLVLLRPSEPKDGRCGCPHHSDQAIKMCICSCD